MAIAFNGTQPNSPNAAYTRLPYAVLDTAPTGSQFTYYMDVFESGSATRISRFTQLPNPADAAIFDPSRVFQGQLSEDENWKITGSIDLANSAKTFDLKVGNATSTSATGSLTFNPYQVSQSINVGMAVVAPNTGTFNLINPAASTTALVLTNTVQNTSLFLDPDDYATISLLNVSSQILAVSCSYSNVLTNTAITSSYFTVDPGFTSIPIGGKNLGITADWEKLVVDVDFSGGRPTQTYTYVKYAGPCKEKIRFAWINKLGAWDYYNVYNPVVRSSDIQREIVVEPRVDYSSATSTYDISRRGENQYYSSYSDTFTVHTGFVDRTEAQWLEELIESPTVYMQRYNSVTEDGEFVPLIIRNSAYVANTSTARQKLYEYVIEFEPSTTPWGEWVPETIGAVPYEPSITTYEINYNITADSSAGTYGVYYLIDNNPYVSPPFPAYTTQQFLTPGDSYQWTGSFDNNDFVNNQAFYSLRAIADWDSPFSASLYTTGSSTVNGINPASVSGTTNVVLAQEVHTSANGVISFSPIVTQFNSGDNIVITLTDKITDL